MNILIRPGRLEIITGPMFSEKTTELIRRVRRLRHGGYKVQVFNPFIDKRYSTGYVTTHEAQDRIESYPISDLKDLSEKIDKNCDGYAFDEIQLFESGVIDLINELREKRKFVLADGLNLDYKGDPFEFSDRCGKHMGDLIVVADDISYLTAVCKMPMQNGLYCPNPATRTQRIVASKELILVGGKESYEARCPEHHFVEFFKNG